MEHTGDAKSPERKAQIGRELDFGEEACARLGPVVKILEDRLSAVLRKEPSNKEEEDKESQELVPLAHKIRSMHEIVTEQVGRLALVIDRLEL